MWMNEPGLSSIINNDISVHLLMFPWYILLNIDITTYQLTGVIEMSKSSKVTLIS